MLPCSVSLKVICSPDTALYGVKNVRLRYHMVGIGDNPFNNGDDIDNDNNNDNESEVF